MAMKLDRLRKRADFLALAKSTQKGIAKSVVLQSRAAPAAIESAAAENPVRIGFTATKKLGNAVIRNRAKRRLRAAIREVLLAAPIPPHDIVLIAREEVLARDYKILLGDLRYCLKKAGVLEASGKTQEARGS